MISRQAKRFWAILRSYPKQVEMPLSKARESDLLAEYLTSEPTGILSRRSLKLRASGPQYVFPIWAGAFPEADAAIRLIGNWVRTRATKSGD